MKKISTLFFLLVAGWSVNAQSTYVGNQANGFYDGNAVPRVPGPVGGSQLIISETVSTIDFTFYRGNGNLNDAFVMYIDSKNGGVPNTSTYTDETDQLRRAISGVNGSNRSLLNFASAFQADYAVAFGTGVNSSHSSAPYFGGLWSLDANTLSFISAIGLDPNNSVTSSIYHFSITKSAINFSTSFKFVITYLNYDNAYRSNEGYGLGFNRATSSDIYGNPGYNSVSLSNYLTYPATILPVKLISFAGTIAESKAKLTWQVANDNEISKYEIEKSVDGKKFSSIQTINAQRTTAAQNYTTEDATLSGTNYYRLKTTDLQGVVSYSKIVQLSINVKGQGISIFPNPVQQTLNIKMAKLEKGQYDVKVYSAAGQLVFAKAIQYDGSGNTLQVELPSNLQSGSYNCILNNKESKFTSSFLKQ
jgi:hypothetical protein